jgi:mannose-6-phosphate isomerase-like protein (cupin superfamily)
MELRSLVREKLVRENGVDGDRLMPWEVLNAPFEGAWVVVEPGGGSGSHAHHEYEIFIAMTGEAELESAGERAPFRAGDIVFFPPHTDHRVINNGADEFQFYAVWWDPEMSERFAERHAGKD